MNKQEFENKAYNYVIGVLNDPNVLVAPSREGFDVMQNGALAFNITVVGMFSVLYVKGNMHDLSADKMSVIYNKCCDLHVAQPDKIYNYVMDILNKSNIFVVPSRHGFDVLQNGVLAFNITIVDLFRVLYINGNTHELPAEQMISIYNKCNDLYSAQQDKALVRTQKEVQRVRAQHETLAYLRRLSRKK